MKDKIREGQGPGAGGRGRIYQNPKQIQFSQAFSPMHLFQSFILIQELGCSSSFICYKKLRGVFFTLSNIYNWAFFAKIRSEFYVSEVFEEGEN